MQQRFQRFGLNTRGRDFAAGDLHGCFRELEACLHGRGFDPRLDRLFCAGDLVNKGPASEEVLDWLAQPWFHAVRGNHEQIVIDACTTGVDREWYIAHGGGWFYARPEAERLRYAEAFQRLPVAIEIDTAMGLVGMVHSEVLGSWSGYIRNLVEDAWPITQRQLWGQKRFKKFDCTPVEGLDMLVVGHVRVPAVTELGNTYYIDTGCHKTGTLTVLPFEDIRASVAHSYNHSPEAAAG